MSKLKTVTILGCGPTFVECNYDTDEVWGVNGTYTFAKRLDKLFMTDEESEVESCWYDLGKIADSGTTLVLPLAYPKLRKTGLPIEIFPIDKLMEKFPTRFYSNSIAYMIAYALLYTKIECKPDDARPKVIDGYHKIYFYGIDMMTQSTYIQEKGGCEYWMGVAMGMGVEVINTKGSATGKTWNGKMYGQYGTFEEEVKKEALLAPWELIRVSKASDPQDEWIKNPATGEYECVKTNVRAGQEIATPK